MRVLSLAKTWHDGTPGDECLSTVSPNLPDNRYLVCVALHCFALQMPQYLLIGTSEILSAVTSLEFFYAEAPTTVRGVSAGLNLLTTALGSWMTVPIITLVSTRHIPVYGTFFCL